MHKLNYLVLSLEKVRTEERNNAYMLRRLDEKEK